MLQRPTPHDFLPRHPEHGGMVRLTIFLYGLRRMDARCSSGTPLKGNTGWSSRGRLACWNSTSPMPQLEPQKTEVICYMDDLSAAVPEWRAGDVQNISKVSTITAGSHSEWLLDRDCSSRTSSWPRQTSFEPCTNESSCVRIRRQNLLSFAKVFVSIASTTSCECTATRSCRSKEPLKFMTRLDSDLLRGSFRVSRKTVDASHTQRRSVRNRVQKSTRHRGFTPGSPQSNQAAHPGDDTRWSHRWSSTAATSGGAPL